LIHKYSNSWRTMWRCGWFGQSVW